MKKQTEQSVWQAAWIAILARCNRRIFLFDLDGTVWDDLLVVLNEAFGPVDEKGEKKWRQYDRAFKVLNTMTNGAHLEAEYRDLLTEKTLAEIHAWLRVNHRLVPGIKEFLKMLANSNVTAVAVSNGAYEIADEMFVHHGISMPRVCNSLVMDGDKFVAMEFFHDEDEGVRKGDLVLMAAERGHEVIGCAGDSKGDIGLSTATAKVGGLVIAVNENGLAAWCRDNENLVGGPNGWLGVSNYAEAMHAVQARLGGF